jgi:hypothetical protein
MTHSLTYRLHESTLQKLRLKDIAFKYDPLEENVNKSAYKIQKY